MKPGKVTSSGISTATTSVAASGDVSLHSARFNVPGMHCVGCIRTLEKGLAALDYVDNARANLSLKQVEVTWRGDSNLAESVSGAISNLGFDNHLIEPEEESHAEPHKQSKHLLLCLAVAGFASANIMLLSVSVWSGAEDETARLFNLIAGVIAVPAVFFAGSPFFKSALSALRARHLNMDVPISLAVLLSLLMSFYEALISGGETFFDAGVMLLFFLLIGRYLDHLMREKAASGVQSLARLLPRTIKKILTDGSVAEIDIDYLVEGDRLKILPGDRFPVDARVLSGVSSVDRSVVTGEAKDIPARQGDTFEAGTLNLTHAIEVEAVSDAQSSFLSEVMEMMKAAETSKGRYRRIADRMASIYAPAVHLLALITFLGWLFVVGDVKASMTAAIAVLIITCPCALGLAVPVTHVVAANRLFREGILMRDGSALERLAEIGAVFFDKTGTLTHDELKLAEKPRLPEEHSALLHALASASRHPVSQALCAAYPSDADVELSDLSETPGFGVEAVWRGHRVRLGRRTWVGELQGIETDEISDGTCFAIEGAGLYTFHFSGELVPDAKVAVTLLGEHGYQTVILSGDEEDRVKEVAGLTGIVNWASRLTPRDKIDRIEKARADQNVLMVGDGLNDAPSLSAAHVSMAPASATDVSRASADFVFTRPSLFAVPFSIKLAHTANRVVRQNFALAILYNCIAVPLAIAGYVTPLVAAIAMSASSIVVVANSLRLAFFAHRTGRPASGKRERPVSLPVTSAQANGGVS